ncbi:uncharacterized protein LOC141693936 [Apium graveolens]|uniref:uncharacterized protein LOC141693936 n=1 Tax=Apium graveolens TaxID=4045 RepID=UPI003D7B5377
MGVASRGSSSPVFVLILCGEVVRRYKASRRLQLHSWLQTKEELKRGFKWVVGNGWDIMVAKDPWVTGKNGFMIDVVSNIDSNMKVANLFYQNTEGWDREKVINLFDESDAEAILRMRIPQQLPNESSNGWRKIWKMQIPSKCWQYAGFSFNLWEVDDVSNWLINTLAAGSHDQTTKLAMILWAIWFFRNKKVQNLYQVHTSSNNKENVKWVRLDRGKYKVNVDADIVKGSISFTIGMLLRDHTGFFLVGRTIKLNRPVSVMEAETTGIEEAMVWITSKGITDICIESDSLLPVQAINGTTVFQSEVGHSINVCRSILAVRIDIYAQHVRRLANRASHYWHVSHVS